MAIGDICFEMAPLTKAPWRELKENCRRQNMIGVFIFHRGPSEGGHKRENMQESRE